VSRFKSKYHPDENYKRRNEQNQFVLNRLDVFMELMGKGWLDDVSAEFEKSKELTRFLDAGKTKQTSQLVIIHVGARSLEISSKEYLFHKKKPFCWLIRLNRCLTFRKKEAVLAFFVRNL
jgi:hypothetical protein